MGEPTEHLDVLIVGAGLSGIGAACRLRIDHPERSFAILEARTSSGGTWDLFRYPGVRSDSDMYTLGYRFRPWTGEKALADGASILHYVRETAREYAVDTAIRYDHRVRSADWSSEQCRWTVTVDGADGPRTLTAGVLWSCGGYYDYDNGFQPEYAGLDDFAGTVVHPQHWPEDLDVTGKRVVVIGSGATAVTLVPALARTAEQVTMLQRSPTYILSLPATDAVAARLRRWLPQKAAYEATRWKNVVGQTVLYQLAQKRPRFVRGLIRKENVKLLPDGYDVDTHFTPRYDPWDQRLCLVPDGDLFRAIRRGTADVVTDRIERFTPTGLRLESGAELAADVVVSATGLNLVAFGGMRLAVDGEPVSLPDTMAYRGMMLSGVPNFVYTVGYTNASWTLKADLVAGYMMRVLTHLDDTRTRVFAPRRDPGVGEEPFMDFAAGYVLRSIATLPKQGDREPWRLRQNYLRDRITLRRSKVGADALTFS
ncbi:MAG: NAD(P)/FAD-dependent oxidoreductase [Nocardioidaceae bacterium]|nr:NAD(P)/FAD-dependent oxidoreductase [Nocardioidaceae bacterium]